MPRNSPWAPAAGMYLVGRILASGARLYLAAIAVSMIIFLDVTPQHILIASAVLVVFPAGGWGCVG